MPKANIDAIPLHFEAQSSMVGKSPTDCSAPAHSALSLANVQPGNNVEKYCDRTTNRSINNVGY